MAIDPLAANPLGTALVAIQARLLLAFPAARFLHAVVPARLTPNTWGALVRRTPFIGISFSGLAPDASSGRQFNAVAQFGVFLVTKAGQPDIRLTGDPQGPGLLSMITAACLALHGFTIGGIDPATAAGTISVRGVDNLFADGWGDEAAAIAGLSIDVPVSLVELQELDDFLSQGITWSFPDIDPATTEIDLVNPMETP